jgi:predicted outer membrane repeat protein
LFHFPNQEQENIVHTITRKPHPITTIPLTILTALLLVGALLFILGAGGPTTAQAASDDITVCPDGSCDYTSIGGAVAAADPDDNILVQAGTYTETDITLNKNLSIIGEGAESTIVQAAATPGTASGRVFKVNAGITASIEGMTIRYGNKTGTSETDSGGAIYTQGDLSLSAVIVVSNTTQARGGGIANNGGTLNINTLSWS